MLNFIAKNKTTGPPMESLVLSPTSPNQDLIIVLAVLEMES